MGARLFVRHAAVGRRSLRRSCVVVRRSQAVSQTLPQISLGSRHVQKAAGRSLVLADAANRSRRHAAVVDYCVWRSQRVFGTIRKCDHLWHSNGRQGRCALFRHWLGAERRLLQRFFGRLQAVLPLASRLVVIVLFVVVLDRERFDEIVGHRLRYQQQQTRSRCLQIGQDRHGAGALQRATMASSRSQLRRCQCVCW